MSTLINTTAKGRYSLTVTRGGQQIYNNDSFDNLITNSGMRRMAGFVDSDFAALASNLNAIFLGRGTRTPLVTHSTLETPVPFTSFVGSAGANDPLITNTNIESLPNGGLKVTFTKGAKFTVISTSAAIDLREIGIGPTTTITGADANGLFSIAQIPNAPVIVNAGDVISVKYILELTVENIASVINLSFDARGGTPFPSTKINVRRSPFYKLLSNGTIEAGGFPISPISTTTNVCPALEKLNPAATGAQVHFYETITDVTFSNITSTTFSTPASSNDTQAVASATTYFISGITSPIVKNIQETEDTFKTVYRFLAYPGAWPATATHFNFWRGNSLYQLKSANRTTNGILGVMQTPYTQPANTYVGLDYTFAFTRI